MHANACSRSVAGSVKTYSHFIDMNQNLNIVGASPHKRRAALLRPGCSDKYVRVARSSPGSNAPSLHLEVVSNRLGCATSSRPGCSDKYARVVRSSPESGAPPQSMGMVSNGFGSRNHGQERVKKVGHKLKKDNSLRFGTWNIGSLTGRLAKVGEVMKGRKNSYNVSTGDKVG